MQNILKINGDRDIRICMIRMRYHTNLINANIPAKKKSQNKKSEYDKYACDVAIELFFYYFFFLQ